MHVSEIGEKTGLEEGKAGRVLRLLATKHVFQEGSSLYALFIFSSDGNPSVGKRFCKQSAEHPTTLNQFFVQSCRFHLFRDNSNALFKH